MRTAGLIALACSAACTTGDGSTTTDNRGIQCSAAMTVTGSFAQSTPRPADNPDGCWPIGMWTFTAAMTSNDCSPAPVPLPQYQFQGSWGPDPSDPTGDNIETFTYVTDPNAMVIVKANEGGAGSCAGDLSIFSPDGKQVWSLRPELFLDNTISGDGEFRVYNTDQWQYGN